MSGQPQDPFKAKNEEDPPLQEKAQDLSSFVGKCQFCMMTTTSPEGSLASRCMALGGKENNDVDYIFHANTSSGKVDDLNKSPDVNLGFLTSSGEWASISGKATVSTDKEDVKRHYTEVLKVWLGDLGDGIHNGGPEDPRIAVIKISTKTASYSISRKGLIGTVVEAVKSAANLEPPAINKLVHLSSEELDQLRLGK